MDPRSLGHPDLLAHQAFVRRLARELVRDVEQAEDLAQEAFARALKRPPDWASAARAWFGVVLRNAAGRRAREEASRAAREHSAARAEAVPSTLEALERLELDRRLLEHVNALREPYREAILLRYFEDLSPRAIAAKEGVPVATVKTRLRRALELLRDALDRAHGRRAWVVALLRVGGPPSALVPAVALTVALVAAGSALWVFATRSGGRGERPVVQAALEPASVPAAEARATELSTPDEPREDERELLPERAEIDAPVGARAVPVTKPSPEADGAALVLRGRVLLPDGDGARGASVALGPFTTRTDSRGRFELELSERADKQLLAGQQVRGLRMHSLDNLNADTALVAWLDGWVPAVMSGVGERVQAARATPGEELEPIELVLPAEALPIDGVVLDRTGAPAEGWRIALLDGTPAYADDYRPFTAEELASGTDSHRALGADGAFAFAGLAEGKSYRIRAWDPRTLAQLVSEPLPAGTRDVVLQAPTEPWRALVDGVVVGLDGVALEGVTCRLSMNEYQSGGGTWMNSSQEVVTDYLGRFTFVDVPPVELFIRFGGLGSHGQQRALAPDDAGRGLRVELVRSGAFVLERDGTRRAADTLRVLDGDGQFMPIELDLGPGRTSSPRDVPVPASGKVRGRVSELARWLVLYAGDGEVARLPLVVRFGQEARVRW